MQNIWCSALISSVLKYMRYNECYNIIYNKVVSIYIYIYHYRYAPHKDVSVKDGPHTRRWFRKVIIL